MLPEDEKTTVWDFMRSHMYAHGHIHRRIPQFAEELAELIAALMRFTHGEADLPAIRVHLEGELVDCLYTLFCLSEITGIDLALAVYQKLGQQPVQVFETKNGKIGGGIVSEAETEMEGTKQ